MALSTGPSSPSYALPSKPKTTARDLAAELLALIRAENARGREVRPATYQIGCDGLPNINALDGTDCNGAPSGALGLMNPATRTMITTNIGRAFTGAGGQLGAIDRGTLDACEQTARLLKSRRRFVDDVGNVYGPDGRFLYDGATPAALGTDYSHQWFVQSSGERTVLNLKKNVGTLQTRAISGGTDLACQGMVYPPLTTTTRYGGAARGVTDGTDPCVPKTDHILFTVEARVVVTGPTTIDPVRTGGSHALVVRNPESLAFEYRKPLTADTTPYTWTAPERFSISATGEGLFFVHCYAVPTFSGGFPSPVPGVELGAPGTDKVAVVRVGATSLIPEIVEVVTLEPGRTAGRTFTRAIYLAP